MYVMVDECGKDKIVRIVNINENTLTDTQGYKYNKEKIKYVWKNKTPVKNTGYIRKHLLEEKNNGN